MGDQVFALVQACFSFMFSSFFYALEVCCWKQIRFECEEIVTEVTISETATFVCEFEFGREREREVRCHFGRGRKCIRSFSRELSLSEDEKRNERKAEVSAECGRFHGELIFDAGNRRYLHCLVLFIITWYFCHDDAERTKIQLLLGPTRGSKAMQHREREWANNCCPHLGIL